MQRTAWKIGIALVAALGLLACEDSKPAKVEAPAAEKPAAEKPAAEKPAAEKPTEVVKEAPAAEQPAAPQGEEAKEEKEAGGGGGLLPDPDFSLKTPSLKAPDHGGKNLLGEDKKKPGLLDVKLDQE